MSVCFVAPDTSSSATHRNQRPANEMSYRQAINSLRSLMKHASPTGVHIFSCNVFEDELEAAYSLLDKQDQRRAMKITYSDDFNFVVRFMPSPMHERAHAIWTQQVTIALLALIPNGIQLWGPPGCMPIAATTYQFGRRQKQADAGFQPTNSNRPSIILEVGCSESLPQLKIDAQLWLEHMPDVQLVILLSISRPTPAHPNTPKILIELWRGGAPTRLFSSGHARTRVARVVWQANWTHQAGPFYILLADIFGGQVPPDYGVQVVGVNDRVFLNAAAWRSAIIAAYQ